MKDRSILMESPAEKAAMPGPSALELVGPSAAIARVRELVRRASVLETAVLLEAERGIEAESVAREVHALSRRAAAPFVVVDCAGDALELDQALFGISDGQEELSDLESLAADSLIARVQAGTVFLRDVSELPASLQVRLARLLRDRQARIGERLVPLEFRIVASTLPGIDADVQAHRFRDDLFRRLSGSRIDLPALRHRPEDVPALAMRMLDNLTTLADPRPAFTQAALALLAALTWPGNVAELRDVIARVVTDARGETIQIEQLLPALRLDRAPARFAPIGKLRDARLQFERDYIASVLQHHGWRLAEAAQTLGIQRPNLYRKARQLGITVTRASE